MGDLVLQKVASVLESSFRSTDYLIRMGGDEFAVITTGIRRENAHIVQDKFSRINTVLQNPVNQLPPISLSIGVACSNCGYTDSLYSEADEALYYVKEHGRNGFHVYGEQEEEA